MMHVDKNADSHVVDQNVDRISREIAYVPLGWWIRSKRSSCMQFFFFFFFWMSTRYAYLEDDGSWLMFSEDQGFLGFSSCFQRTKGFGSWLMFLEDQGFLGFWLMFSEDQGLFGLWLMFSEDQRFWILAHVFRGLELLDLGSCFQRTKGFGSWLMFSEA